jgi:hypothetical protein
MVLLVDDEANTNILVYEGGRGRLIMHELQTRVVAVVVVGKWWEGAD